MASGGGSSDHINLSNSGIQAGGSGSGLNINKLNSKVNGSKTASGSKKLGSNAAGHPSGYVGGKSGGGIQVFFNGKIATPQTLIPKKGQYLRAEGNNNSGFNSSLAPQLEDDSNNVEANRAKRMEIQEKVKNRVIPVHPSKVADEYEIVVLSETMTQDLFCLRSLVVSSDSKDLALIQNKNAKYAQIIEFHKNPDGFTCRSSQTVNETQKNQSEMTISNTLRDSACQASQFDITDANNLLLEKEMMEGDILANSSNNYLSKAGLSTHVKSYFESTIEVSLATPGCLLDTSFVKPVEISNTSTKKSKSNKTSGIATQTITAGTSNSNINESNVNNSSSQANITSQQAKLGLNQPSQSGANLDGGVSGSGVGIDESKQSQTNEENPSAQSTQQNTQAILRQREANKIMSSELLLSRILMLERAIQQNVYHRQHLECRDLPDISPLMLLSDEERTKTNNLAQSNTGGFGFGGPVLGLGALPTSNGGESKNSQENFSIQEEEKEAGPQKIKKLFSFYYASLVQGRAVTAMAWNSVNTDILAVSYGRVNFNLDVNSHKLGTPLDEELSGGLVLFWSLRNPEYPEKILRTKQPVTALDFSRFSPMLLAVGCYNGDVMIFDVKREGEDWEKPKESSTTISGGHVEAVWQVKWVSKGSDRLENVVSISTDGNILQWDLKKGLSVQTLMNLKRGGLGDGWISRQAAGLSFDFLHGDPSTYFVGTEEGGVHKCSVSYNEQYLENYESHEGPVYKIRCSNRWPNIFLSCSSDWNIKLFHIRNKKPVLTLHPSGDNDSVVDTVWCPGNSTVFASVTESGKLHIWDLSVSSIDPVVNYDTTVDIEELFPQEETPDTSQEVPDVDKIAALKGTRKEFGRNHDAKDEIKESPVAKLLKNLSNKDNVKSSSNSSSSSSSNTNSGKLVRSLTTVLFSEKSPTIVVGDAKGAVTLYRVVDPVTVLLEGPLQQVSRLKTSILTQADPEDAAKLKSFEELGSQNQ